MLAALALAALAWACSSATSAGGESAAGESGGFAGGSAVGGTLSGNAGAGGALAGGGAFSGAGGLGASAGASAAGAGVSAGGASGAAGASGCPGSAAGAGTSTSTGTGTGVAADSFVSVVPSSTSVELYHPLKIAIVTTQSFKNGFNPDEVKVDAVFTPACGEPITQPCFYESSANDQASWECRFAPRKLANYGYSVVLTEGTGSTKSQSFTLATTPTTSDGFLHADTANAVAGNASSLFDFRFDSGKAWRGVGEDVAWEIGQYTFTQVIPRLHADSLNLFRIWHTSFSLPVEWNSAPNTYNQKTANYFDQIVTLAEQNGVYMMIMLNDFRDFSEHWADSPYNTAKGGWCKTQNEFFTNESAIANHEKKLRYYIARWGYSPAIQSFEFFNEIDNALSGTNIKVDDVATWTDKQATYLHGIDPYNHLVTSSVSWQSMKFWAAKGIDFTQSHLYGPNNRITNLPSQSQSYINNWKKPYVCGEMGARWESATSATPEQNKEELHYGMWLGIVTATPIVPMNWWWDSLWNWGDDSVFESAAGFSNDLVAKVGLGTLAKLGTAASSNLQSGGLATGKYGYAWVSNYNPGSGTQNNVTLTISGLRAGSNPYTVEAFDTWNGGFAAPVSATSQNAALAINVGTLKTSGAGSDAAYRITDVNGP